jgi:hypothetical protein
MSIEQAAVFLAGSVLIILGFIIIVAGLCVINNLIHKYWKPIRVFTVDSFTLFNGNSTTPKFITPEQSQHTSKSSDSPK